MKKKKNGARVRGDGRRTKKSQWRKDCREYWAARKPLSEMEETYV